MDGNKSPSSFRKKNIFLMDIISIKMINLEAYRALSKNVIYKHTYQILAGVEPLLYSTMLIRLLFKSIVVVENCSRVLEVFSFHPYTHRVSFPHIVFLFSENVRISTLLPTAVTARRAYTSACPVSSQSLVYSNGFFVSMHSLLICATHTFIYFSLIFLIVSIIILSLPELTACTSCCIQPQNIAFARG